MVTDTWIQFQIRGDRIRDLGWDVEVPERFRGRPSVIFVLPRSVYKGEIVGPSGLWMETLDPKDVTTQPRDTDLPRLFPWRNITFEMGKCLIAITPLIQGKTECIKKSSPNIRGGPPAVTHYYTTGGLLHDVCKGEKFYSLEYVVKYARYFNLPTVPLLYSGMNDWDVIRKFKQEIVIERIANRRFKSVLRDYENPIPRR